MRSDKEAVAAWISPFSHHIQVPHKISILFVSSVSWAAVATRSDLKLRPSMPVVYFRLTLRAQKAKCVVFISKPTSLVSSAKLHRLHSSQIPLQSCLWDFFVCNLNALALLCMDIFNFKCISLCFHFYCINTSQLKKSNWRMLLLLSSSWTCSVNGLRINLVDLKQNHVAHLRLQPTATSKQNVDVQFMAE